MDDWFFGIRLETSQSPRSTNVTFGDDTSGSSGAGANRAADSVGSASPRGTAVSRDRSIGALPEKVGWWMSRLTTSPVW